MIWRVSTAALLVLAALLAWPLVQRYREQPSPPLPTLRLSLAAPPGTELGVADDGLDAALSPAGDEVVFVATAGGRAQLWRRPLDTERAEPIAGTEGGRTPAWSADGRTLAFLAAGRLKTIARTGGEVRDRGAAQDGRGVAALDDGSLVFAAAAGGTLTRLRDGASVAATRLQPGDREHAWPARAPGGFVYVAVRGDGRRVMRLDRGGATRDLGTTDGHALVAGSILLHVRGGALLAQRLDDSGAPAGRAVALATDVGTASGRSLVAASSRLLLLAAAATRARELVWLEADGTRGPAASERGDYWQVRVSPDDRAAAVTMLEPQLRTLDVFLQPLVPGAVATGLSLALAADTDPVWSPDGRRVMFRSLLDGQPQLLSRAAGTPGAEVEPVFRSGTDAVPTDWRGTGTTSEVLFHGPGARADTDVILLRHPSHTARTIAGSGFNESDGRWSPDLRWLAYVSDEFGQPDVFVQRWPAGGRVRVTAAGGLRPRWGAEPGALYFLRGDAIARVTVSDGDTPSVSAPADVARVPGIRDFDAAHRSRRLLAVLPGSGARPVDARALVDWQTAVPAP